jgi:hypothetical protein
VQRSAEEEQELKDGAESQCRGGQSRSRNSRTVQGVSAEVGRVGAGTQGRFRESVQRWAEEEQEIKDDAGSQRRGGHGGRSIAYFHCCGMVLQRMRNKIIVRMGQF